ncbi:MAG: hypothetical protein DMD41_02535 [Gemmatimonadetes bacterium]|nr:MAG: hypothetical protein DMD41_02535 [Gemmatimonadota bacterium]
MTTTPRTSTPIISRCAPPSARSAPTACSRQGSTPGSLSSARGASTGTTTPTGRCMSVFKDGVPANTHFLNLLPTGVSAPPVERIPLYEVYMRMAEELAKRSTCARLQVGTVVTDQVLENVLAIGYNGNARGLANTCDSTVPGNCGCIHSEMNALVKAPGNVRDKVMFISASPCVMCAKLIINSGVTHVFYRKAYRDPSGIEVLQQGGIVPVLYDRWVREWR